jgi:glyoxylase-like metal-dependent hydrolase (beta-lactamase superfamily II)
MIKIEKLTFNPFQENTYLVWDDTLEAVVIDPGCSNAEERKVLKQTIETLGLKVVKLLNTHTHIDHVLGNAFVQQTYGVALHLHAKDLPTLLAVKAYAPNYGFPDYQEVTPTEWLEEGKEVSFGNSSFEVRFVPGHAPGHVAFLNLEQRICVGGDVLFKGSIGRTDFPGCSFEVLAESIRTQLFALPDDVVVYPGHGPSTTIGYEREWNPFVGKNAQYSL